MARVARPIEQLRPQGVSSKLDALLLYLDGLEDRADLAVLADLLRRLDVSRRDIAPTCVFGVKGYRRNCVARSEWFELLACCWRSGDRTPIHDHRGVSCAFKVVEGEGTEVRFQTTPSGLICPTQSVPLHPGSICAAEDSDIHQVANMQAPGSDLITLHIYSPPIKKMHTYDWGQCSTAESGDCYDVPC